MARATRLLTAGLACALPILAATTAAAVRGPAGTVVLISIDGARWDDPGRAGASTLAWMAQRGATAARGLVPPFPASTFPAHATLATGVYSDRHGILNNEFLDRSRGLFLKNDDASWLLAEPIWVTAERQGVPTAVDGWVCASTPWRGTAASIRVPFAERISDAATIDRILGWLNIQGSGRPGLILAYLAGADAAGHATGPGSPEVRRAILRTDRLLQRVIRAMEEGRRPTALVVVSDHGMARVRERIDTHRLLGGDARGARVVPTGATANVYCPSRPAACDAAASVLRRHVRGLSLFSREDLPPDLRYELPARTGDLVAIAPVGSWFGAEEREGGAEVRGMHGYRPTEPEMRGIFYAWGAGLRRGARIDRVRAIDIEPLVCRLLGIDPPDGIDGTVPMDLLAPITAGAQAPARPPAARRGRAAGSRR